MSASALYRSLFRLPFGRHLGPGRLPDFLGIGAQRSGTTTLYELLRRHPETFLPDEKELHYFSLHHHRPLGWYAAKFAAAAPGRRVGEISPYCLFHPEAPARIAAALPHVKLIALLRDPVDRALSGYRHARRLGRESLEIEAAFDAEAGRLRDAAPVLVPDAGRHPGHQWHSYLARSRYEEQLARYQAQCPGAPLLVLRSEDLFTTPQATWTQQFLGLSVCPPSDPLPHRNQSVSDQSAVSPALRDRLRQALAPTYRAMAQDYGIRWPESDTRNDAPEH
jgi:hypothetical protein